MILDDFLLIGANAAKELEVKFLDYLYYFVKDGINDVEKELLNLLKIKKLPNRSDEDMVMGIIAKTFNEKDKKMKEKEYYICNAICIK